MWRLLLAAELLLFASCGHSPEYHELGKWVTGQEASVEFPLENDCGKPRTIDRVTVSCGCQSVFLRCGGRLVRLESKREAGVFLDAGEKFTVGFDFAVKPGRHSYGVAVHYSDGAVERRVAQAQGVRSLLYSVEPSFERLACKREVGTEFSVSIGGPGLAKMERLPFDVATRDCAVVSTAFEPSQHGLVMRGLLTASRNASASVAATITFHMPDGSRLPLVLDGDVVSSIVSIPDGALMLQSGRTRTVKFRARENGDDIDLVIRSATFEGGGDEGLLVKLGPARRSLVVECESAAERRFVRSRLIVGFEGATDVSVVRVLGMIR